jgi:hypothetical protein
MGDPHEGAATVDDDAGRIASGVVIAAVVVVVAIVLGLSLLGLRSFYGADIMESFAPWRSLPPDGVVPTNPLVGDTVDTIMPEKAAMRSMLGLSLPTWNPLQLGGTAFASIRNAGVFSVLNVPFWVLPLWYAPAISKLLELAVAIGFTAWFLRLHGLHRASSIVGGLVFAFSGFQVAWNNWHQTHVGALVAALFWSIEMVFVKRRAVWALPLVAVVATMWFEGFPSVTGYGLAFGGAYAVVRALSISEIRVAVGRLVVLGAGVLVGTAVAAVQLVPFYGSLVAQDLSERTQVPGIHLPIRTIATIVVPNAFGSPVDRNYFGPINYIEIQSFIGIAAVVLIVAALVYGRSVVRPSVLWYFVGAAAVAASLMWIGGPLLELLQKTPLFGLNFVGRLRSVLGFLLAVVAAIGLEAVLRGLPARAGWGRRSIFAVALGVAGAIAGGALLRAWQMAEANLQTDYLRDRLIVAGVIAVATVVAMGFAHVAHARTRVAVVIVLPFIIAIEVTTFAGPFWPQTPVEQFYPSTSTHAFISENIGDERVVVAGLALYPSTTAYFGIRSVTGHAFHDEEWQDLLEVVDPDVMDASPTFSILASRSDVGLSPVLDRMSARYFATDPRIALAGWSTRLGEPDATISVQGGSVFEVDAISIPRGVSVSIVAGFDPGTQADEFILEGLDPTGAVVSVGSRRIDKYLSEGPLHVAIPEDQGVVRLRLRYEGDTAVPVVSTTDGVPVFDITYAQADNLRLVIADAMPVYERLGALERIRWASDALVVPDEATRLRLLGEGIDGETVVLDDGEGQASGGDGSISVLSDTGDTIALAVVADGAGFVVVAETIQTDWVATLDGELAPILDADHAFGAIAVPEGTHTVELRHVPPGGPAGSIISASAVLLSLTMLGITAVRARSVRRLTTTDEEPDEPA